MKPHRSFVMCDLCRKHCAAGFKLYKLEGGRLYRLCEKCERSGGPLDAPVVFEKRPVAHAGESI